METTDFTELRAAAAIKAPRVFVDRSQLEALLQLHDAQQAAEQALKCKTKAGYPEEFEQCWAIYPSCPNPSKSSAHKAWAARRKQGVSAAALLAGTERYAAYVKATRTDPQFVKNPATFFGPDEHFALAWTVFKTQLKGPQHGRIRDQDFGAGAGQDGRF
jgi:hypothetical protein